MQNERAIKRTGRLAPLAQVALAALVAGSLLTFSTIAFRTAFDEPSRGRGVKVSSPHTEPAAPVVLPTPPKEAAVARTEETDDVVAEIVATIAPSTNTVANDTEERQTATKDKDKNRFSEPRVVLPGTDGDRNLSGFGPDDHDGDEGKSKGHGKSKGKHGRSHEKGRGHGHKGHGHKGHGHKGHRHPRGRNH